MHHHPDTLFLLHKERQARLEVEAARYALTRGLRRRHKWRWRRSRSLKPVPAPLRPLLR